MCVYGEGLSQFSQRKVFNTTGMPVIAMKKGKLIERKDSH